MTYPVFKLWLTFVSAKIFANKISCINIPSCDLDTGAGGGGAAAGSASSPKRDWERVRRLTWSTSTVQYSTAQYTSTVQYLVHLVLGELLLPDVLGGGAVAGPAAPAGVRVVTVHSRGSRVTCQTSWIWIVPSAPPNL